LKDNSEKNDSEDQIRISICAATYSLGLVVLKAMGVREQFLRDI
jgi:hypothetical protein